LQQTTQDSLQHILQNKIVAIVRGIAPAEVLKIAHALHEGGVTTMEVTLNSDDALSVIKELCDVMQDKMLIGAGTVLGADMAHKSIDAGARFIISPVIDEETIRATKERGVISIPGAFTPTEIYKAFMLGADIIKVFPASSNVSYIKEVRAPLPHIPLMPTGGITLQNIQEFKKAGAIAFGIGGSLVDAKRTVTNEYLKRVTDTAQQFIRLVNEE
jgi:2-dehydro-3-deoxyphosphogluconate aldolase / (4S)-4-hydroxy-2-oxoglutarate aldolase